MTQHDRKHILLLTAAFPGPAEPSRAVSVANAARLLARHFSVTVLTPRVHPSDPQHEKLPHYEVVRFPYHTGGRILKHYTHVPVLRLVSYFLSGLTAALRIAHSRRVCLIYANWVLPAGLIGAVAALLLKLPLISHAHGSDINIYARKNPFFRLFARFVLGMSDRVLAVGHDLLHKLETGLRVPPWKAAYSPPVIDTSIFFPGPKLKARRELGLPAKGWLALFVGDITAAKGADLFFAAAADSIRVVAQPPSKKAPAGQLATGLREMLRSGQTKPHPANPGSGVEVSNPCARFCLIGGGPLRAGLLRESRSHPAISLPGLVPNEQVAVYMRAADLLVLPSYTEGRPVSVLEAIRTGLPVLATKVGDLPEMITDGKNGILIEPGDKSALVTQLRRLLASPKLLARLRKGMSQSRREPPPVLPAIIENVITGPDYDRYWRSARAAHFRRRARERARAAISILPIREGSALDAGCGRGELLEALGSFGFEVKGVDISPVAVEEARRRGHQAEVLDVEKDALQGTYDIVLCLELLEHLKRPAAALHKLAAVVKPEGCLVVSLPNESNFYHRLKNFFAPNPAHRHRFNHGKALELFASAGLCVKRRLPVPLLPSLPGLELVRSALCRLWPAIFAVSNIYLLSAPGAGSTRRQDKQSRRHGKTR